MSKEIDFATGTVVPSSWLDGMQEVESALHFGVRLEKASATQIQLAPLDDGNDAVPAGQSSIRINGKPYWWTSTITKTVSGGAGTYGVYATGGAGTTLAEANITLTTGAAPANSRKIGSVVWSGSAITAVKQDGMGSVHGPMIEDGALTSGGTITWTRNASGAWVAEVAANAIGASAIGTLPQCLVRKTTKTAIGGASDTYLTFPTEAEDTDAMHSTVSNTGRIVCVTPGLYLFHFTIHWYEALNNTNAAFATWFRKTAKAGGTQQIGKLKTPGVASPAHILSHTVSKPIRLVAEDYVEVGVFTFEAKELDGEDATFGQGQEFGCIWLSD